MDNDSVGEAPRAVTSLQQDGCQTIPLDECSTHADASAIAQMRHGRLYSAGPSLRSCGSEGRHGQLHVAATRAYPRQMRRSSTDVVSLDCDSADAFAADDVQVVESGTNISARDPARRGRSCLLFGPTAQPLPRVVGEDDSESHGGQAGSSNGGDGLEVVSFRRREVVDLTHPPVSLEVVRFANQLRSTEDVITDNETSTATASAVVEPAPSGRVPSGRVSSMQPPFRAIESGSHRAVMSQRSSRSRMTGASRARSARSNPHGMPGVASSTRITRERRATSSDPAHAEIVGHLSRQFFATRMNNSTRHRSSLRTPQASSRYANELPEIFARLESISRRFLEHERRVAAIRSQRQGHNWTYEQLLQLDEDLDDRRHAASETVISGLPVRKATEADMDRACCICLDDVVCGDELRVLPCAHQIHRNCIDDWLRRKGWCPMDKMRVDTLEFAE